MELLAPCQLVLNSEVFSFPISVDLLRLKNTVSSPSWKENRETHDFLTVIIVKAKCEQPCLVFELSFPSPLITTINTSLRAADGQEDKARKMIAVFQSEKSQDSRSKNY